MTRLASENAVIQSPTSYTGSARRLWRITRSDNAAVRWALLVPLAIVLVALAWVVVTCWYAVFGILAWPYRLMRRGQRKRKVERLRHRELLER